MKTNRFPIIAGLTAALFTQASAIEAPPDNAPPPPAVDSSPEAEVPAEQPAKPDAGKVSAYLGVVSSEVPEMLADHLDLKPGEGIVVRSVMPDGPAAKAGVVVYDVVTRVGGQPVGSALDLTKEITARKPGEAVHLDIIHKGKPVGIDVTLGTRPNEIAGGEVQPLDQLNLEGIPKELADRVRGMIEGNLGGVEMQFGGDAGLEAPPQMEDAMRQMKERMEKAMEQGLKAPQLLHQGRLDIQQGATIRMMDEKGSVELKTHDGSKEVTLRDKDNKITWSGPWDTEQDKAAAPDDVRQRMERIDLDTHFKGNGLRLRGGLRMPDEGGE